MLQLRVNVGKRPPKMDVTTGLHDKVLHYFAGRDYPVESTGPALTNTGSVEFTVTSIEDRNRAHAMAKLSAPHLFRLPDGTTKYCSISPVQDTRLDEGWYKITLSVTEVGK